METFYNQPVVIDNGSGNLKAGFAGEDKPRLYGLAIIGRPKYQKIMAGLILTDEASKDDTFIGNVAQQNRGLLRLSYPIEHGVVVNWDDMEKLWAHTYTQELRINAEEHPLLITEAPLNPRSNRDRMCQVLFEQFNVPCMYISIQAVLSLYASGRTTGVVIDSGDGVTHIVPVYEGFALPTSQQRMDIAGRDITHQLAYNIRSMTGLALKSLAELEVVRQIKEKVCFISKDPVKDEKHYSLSAYTHYLSGAASDNELFSSYKLPDGQLVKVGVERFRSPEILFNPQIVGDESPGIHNLTALAIGKTDLDLRPTLYQNIILSGGNTLIKNFGDRLLTELKTNTPAVWGSQGKVPDTKMKVRIYAPPERKYLTWIGGSILAGLSTFKKMWITSKEFEEDPNIVHHKM